MARQTQIIFPAGIQVTSISCAFIVHNYLRDNLGKQATLCYEEYD